MPKLKVVITAAALTATCGVAAAAGIVRLGGSGSEFNPVATALASDQLSADDRGALASAGASEDIKQVAERAGVRFYVSDGLTGSCYITGSSAGLGLAVIACLDDGAHNFPSPKQPVLDLSSYRGEPAPSTRRFLTGLAGFAADGVTTVTVETSDGEILSTDVSNNVYASDAVLSTAVVRIAAFDSSGAEIWSRPLGGPPPPPVP